MKKIITGLPVEGLVIISVFSCLHRKTNTQGRDDSRSGHICFIRFPFAQIFFCTSPSLLCFFSILFAHSASPIYWCQLNYQVSINLWKFTVCIKCLTIHIFLWRCKLKPLQNENLKKPIINLSQNIIHMTSIFLNVFWIQANTVNVRGKNRINIVLSYCAVRWIAWTKNNFRDRVHVIQSKQQVHEHIVRLQCVLFSLFNTQGLWIIFWYCLAGTKIQRSYKAY